MDMPDKVRVGEVLLKRGIVSQEQLSQALTEQRVSRLKLGEILIKQGLVTRYQLRHALNQQRWHNWTVTALISISSLAAITPRVVSALPAVSMERTGGATALKADLHHEPHHDHADDHVHPEVIEHQPTQYQANNVLSDAGFHMPLAANPSPTVASPLRGFCHPLNGAGYLSQGIRGTTHQGRMEYAYDLAAKIGTPVYAMRAGRVLSLQDRFPDTGGGPDKISKFNYVMIEHDGGYRSAYLHLQQGFRGSVGLKAGDRVETGQLIGYSGNSGWSTGPHLHVEVQRPGGGPLSFTKSVPFAIAGACGPSTIASTPVFN